MSLTKRRENTILIVDDAPINIDYLIKYLTRAGYRLLVAKDGKTGLDQAKYSKPDIILLDVLMPDVDGFTVCRQLQDDPRTQNIPVIFMTALSSVVDKVKAFEAGAVDYLTKPIDHREAIARINTHLTLRNLHEELQGEVEERKKTEERLRGITQILQSQNEELDAFAHTVAHNLKNPLALLTSLAEYLQLDHSTMKQTMLDECLGLMARDGRRAINIVEELLLLSSIRKEEVETLPLDMLEIVTQSQQRLSNLIDQSESQIIFPKEWPLALGYGPWVEEVWVNYLSNAIKYGGEPPLIELGASRERDRMVRFWVKDNGPGLSPQEQSQLFTPFTRLNAMQVEGHGLGLSIVRRIIEKLGGNVGIDSAGIPGRGSVFNFTLPAVAN
ncbi:MAG: hybrid sensor histidine kinase/response regulator [Anaerolineae bacterium]|nr:hybrid sensor histidine kinase/response regulator [Anaerolineae bacterium]